MCMYLKEYSVKLSNNNSSNIIFLFLETRYNLRLINYVGKSCLWRVIYSVRRIYSRGNSPLMVQIKFFYLSALYLSYLSAVMMVTYSSQSRK